MPDRAQHSASFRAITARQLQALVRPRFLDSQGAALANQRSIVRHVRVRRPAVSPGGGVGGYLPPDTASVADPSALPTPDRETAAVRVATTLALGNPADAVRSRRLLYLGVAQPQPRPRCPRSPQS